MQNTKKSTEVAEEVLQEYVMEKLIKKLIKKLRERQIKFLINKQSLHSVFRLDWFHLQLIMYKITFLLYNCNNVSI